MITKTIIEFDDADYSRETAFSLAKEGLRRSQQSGATRIVIVSAFEKYPDANVEVLKDRIVVSTRKKLLTRS